MILYHYSNKKLKSINPKYFGKNCYTSNDKNISNVKRTFFYDKKNPEFLLNDCLYIHHVKISKKNIYDITKDKKKILKKYNNDIDKALRYFKSKKLIVTYNNGLQVYNSFQSLKAFRIATSEQGKPQKQKYANMLNIRG